MEAWNLRVALESSAIFLAAACNARMTINVALELTAMSPKANAIAMFSVHRTRHNAPNLPM